ncbi:MAG: hypothetical protein WC634_05555 [archaeon]
MEISEDALAFGKIQIAAAIAIFAATMLWAAFFGLTGMSLNDFLTLKFNIVLEKILANLPAVALFLLTFSLPVAIITAFAKKMEKINLMLLSGVSSFFALTIAMLLFPAMQGFWIVAIFYIIGIFLAVEEAFTKRLELKKRITARTNWSATGKTAALVSIGLVVLFISSIAPEHEQYLGKVDDFAMSFVEIAIPSNGKNPGITSAITDTIVNTQIATVNALLENSAYTKLKGKTDPDVMLFVATADATREYFKGPEFRKTIEKTLNETSTDVMGEIKIVAIMREQFPVLNTVEKVVPLGILFGLAQALAIAGLFSMLALFICRPMAVVYGLITEKALALGGSGGKEQPTNN